MSERVDQRFGLVPLWLIESGASDRAVAFYAWLAAVFLDGSEARADESIEWFAEQSGRSGPSVKRAFAELEEKGAVTRIRRIGQPSLTQIRRSDPISRSDQKCSDEQIENDPAIPLVETDLKDTPEDSSKRSDQEPDPLETQSSPSTQGGREVSSARQVFDHWQRVMEKPRAKFDASRKTKIEARLSDGYTVEDLKRAIDGCAASDWHMGRDPMNDVTAGGKRYDTIGLIFRNGEKVEDFISRAPDAPAGHRHKLLELAALRESYHDFEAEDLRSEDKYPFDAESDRRIAEAGLEA